MRVFDHSPLPLAVVDLERAVQLERSTPLSFFSSQPHTYLGMLYKAHGAWEDASRCFSEAVALTRARLMHNRVNGLEASRVRAKILACKAAGKR